MSLDVSRISPISQFQVHVVREEKVSSIFLGDVFTASRRSIEVMGGSESEIVEETKLAFARNAQHGQLDDVFDFSFSTSTNTCVKKSRSEFINSGSFRGTDFDCRFNECRCLYVKVLWIASTAVALTQQSAISVAQLMEQRETGVRKACWSRVHGSCRVLGGWRN